MPIEFAVKIVRLKGLYDHCQSDDLDLHSRSCVQLELDYGLTGNIWDKYLSCYIQTWHDGRRWDTISRPIWSDSIQWPWPWCKDTVGQQRQTNQRCWMLSAATQAIRNCRLFFLFFFYVTLTLQTLIWLDQLASFLLSAQMKNRFISNSFQTHAIQWLLPTIGLTRPICSLSAGVMTTSPHTCPHTVAAVYN